DSHDLVPKDEIAAPRLRQPEREAPEQEQANEEEPRDADEQAAPPAATEPLDAQHEQPNEDDREEHAEPDAARPSERGPEPVEERRGLARDADALGGGHPSSGRSKGKAITSRIEGWPVSAITSRSMPIPKPAAGGIPYSSART